MRNIARQNKKDINTTSRADRGCERVRVSVPKEQLFLNEQPSQNQLINQYINVNIMREC